MKAYNRLLNRLNLSVFWKPVVVIGICALAFQAGKNVQAKDSTIAMLIAAAIGGLGYLILSSRIELGLLALIPAALWVPFSISTGTYTKVNAVMLAVLGIFAIWFFNLVVMKRKLRFAHPATLRPLLGLCLAATLSFGIGQIDWFIFANHAPLTSQLGGLMLFFLSAIAYLLTANLIQDVKWLKYLVWLFLLAGAAAAIGRMVPGFSVFYKFFNRGSDGSLFWVWLTALSLSQALFNRKLSFIWRAALLALALGTALGRFTLLRGWASGWFPVFVGMLFVIVAGTPRLGVPLAFVALFFGFSQFQGFTAGAENIVIQGEEYSYLTRVEAWSIVLEIVRTNPLTGFGPANYYFYTSLVPIRGYYLPINSHNQYIDLLAQAGLIGLGFFLWFAWENLRLSWKLARSEQGFERAYAIGALGGLAGTLAAGMLADWIIPFVYNIGFEGFRASFFGWLFLGGSVCLDTLRQRRNSAVNS